MDWTFILTNISLVLILKQRMAITGIAIEDRTGNWSVEEDSNMVTDFLMFMEAHQSRCGFISLCTLEKNETYSKTRMEPCCHDCSCQQSCVSENRCCPDYWLKIALNLSSPFTSLDDFNSFMISMNESQIAALETTHKIGLNNSLEESTESTVKTNRSHILQRTCVRTESNKNNLPFRPAFMLVSECPGNTPSALAEKCENNDKLTDLMDHVPFTTSDGVSFKNRHCLICNGYQIEEALSWGVFVVSNRIQEVFMLSYSWRYLVSGLDMYCTLQFLPNSKIEQSVETCVKYDIETCANTTGLSVLDYMCRASTSPVKLHAENFYYLSVAKNLACYLCSNDTAYNGYTICMRKSKHPSRVMLTSIDYVSRSLPPGDSNLINMSFHSTCDTGFAFDTYKNVCRKVYCPELHILVDGKCQILYSNVNHIVFGMTLLATMSTQFLQSAKEDRKRTLIKVHKDIVMASKHKLSVDSNASLWFDEFDQTNVDSKHIVVYLTVHKKATIFQTIFDQTLMFMNTLVDSEHISEVRLTSRVVVNSVARGTVYDVKREMFYRRHHPSPIMHMRPSLMITDSMYCLKVALGRNEVSVKGKHVFVLNNANVTLYYALGLHVLNKSSILVCYNELQKEIIKSDDEVSVNDNGANKETTDDVTGLNTNDVADLSTDAAKEGEEIDTRGSETVLSKPLAVTICLAAVTLLVIGIRLLRYVRRKVKCCKQN